MYFGQNNAETPSKKGKKMKYKVMVQRRTYADMEIEVEAVSKSAAEATAIAKAKDTDFKGRTHHSEYEVMYVEYTTEPVKD